MKKLKTYEFKSRGRRGEVMPWDEILDGQVTVLVRGEDFSVLPTTLVNNAKAVAKEMGLAVKSEIDGETVVLQSFKKED